MTPHKTWNAIQIQLSLLERSSMAILYRKIWKLEAKGNRDKSGAKCESSEKARVPSFEISQLK